MTVTKLQLIELRKMAARLHVEIAAHADYGSTEKPMVRAERAMVAVVQALDDAIRGTP